MINRLRFLWMSVTLLALILGLLLGAVLYAPTARADAEAQIEARASMEYHRGAYDTCAVFAAQYFAPPDVPGACLRAVRIVMDSDWFGQPSDGWEWPLP